MNKKNPILFIQYPSTGHTKPTFKIIDHLVKNDQPVVCMNNENYRDKYDNLDVEFKPYRYDVDILLEEDFSYFNIVRAVMDKTENVLETLIEDVRKLNPKIIIYDTMTPWGKITANYLSIKGICSVTTNYHRQNRISQFLWYMDMAAEEFKRYTVFRNLMKQIKRINSKYNSDISLTTAMFNYNDSNIIYTSKYFYRKVRKEDYFTGMHHPFYEEAKYNARIDQADKVIYISFGTILPIGLDLLQRCFKAYEGSTYLIIFSIGNQMDLRAIENVPANCIIKRKVNQVDILKKTDLFISHCGMNSAQEALYSGVPLFMMPVSADQPAVAKRIARLGAGIKVKYNISAVKLRQLTDKVFMEGKLKQKAQEIQELYKSENDLFSFIEFINNYPQQH